MRNVRVRVIHNEGVPPWVLALVVVAVVVIAWMRKLA
jgi:hypothetical protein